VSWRPGRVWRRGAYYKVQVQDAKVGAWTDEKPAFDNLSDAKNYIRDRIPTGTVTRIMVVEGRRRRHPLSEGGES
jgi:hypothetical protein